MRLAQTIPTIVFAAIFISVHAAHAAVEKNACAVLPPDEASVLYGAPVKPMAPTGVTCMDMTADGSGGMVDGVMSANDPKSASAIYDHMVSLNRPNSRSKPCQVSATRRSSSTARMETSSFPC